MSTRKMTKMLDMISALQREDSWAPAFPEDADVYESLVQHGTIPDGLETWAEAMYDALAQQCKANRIVIVSYGYNVIRAH